jgi:hypothetical protein
MEIIQVPPEKYFYVNDGTVIKHLAELPEALRNMHPDTFAFHVNSEKNDFHSWVNDVFSHSSLARKIKSTKQKELMAKKVFTEIFS